MLVVMMNAVMLLALIVMVVVFMASTKTIEKRIVLCRWRCV